MRTMKVWRLTGSLAGLPVDEVYYSKADAKARRSLLKAVFVEPRGKLTITEVEEEYNENYGVQAEREQKTSSVPEEGTCST